jgi:glycosyltransferase involved in cell wall biosynthesis
LTKDNPNVRIYLSKEANKTISWTRLNYNEAADKSSNPKVVVIFVTKNEDNTIENSITIAKRSYYKPEVLVVDAHSTDKTAELASKTGAIVILQSKQMFPGKGLAMKEGLKEAVIKLAADIIVFLDADIRNLTSEWIDKLVGAIIYDNCDMSRGFYTRHARDAAVTKLVARPMLHVFFPELSHFEQPLSGEVCARGLVWGKLLEKESIPEGWGIDVWFLIEAVTSGYNIKEIFLGQKEHTSFEDYKEDVSKLSKMAEQVEFTIIREAIKYGRIESQSNVSV